MLSPAAIRKPSAPARLRGAGRVLLGLCLGLVSSAVAGCTTTPASRPRPAFQEIASPTGLYSITPMLGGWSSLEDASDSGTDADLVLMQESAGVTALVLVTQGSAESLDGIVLGRKQLIEQSYQVLDFEEVRRFAAAGVFRPVSIATYRVRIPPQTGWSFLLAAAVRGERAVVEILLLGGTAPLNTQLLDDLVGGLRFPGDDGGSR